MSDWISVDDRLPKSGDTVIVCFSTHEMDVDIDWVNCCVDSGELYFDNYAGKVTHWMPLPEPPKESK